MSCLLISGLCSGRPVCLASTTSAQRRRKRCPTGIWQLRFGTTQRSLNFRPAYHPCQNKFHSGISVLTAGKHPFRLWALLATHAPSGSSIVKMLGFRFVQVSCCMGYDPFPWSWHSPLAPGRYVRELPDQLKTVSLIQASSAFSARDLYFCGGMQDSLPSHTP